MVTELENIIFKKLNHDIFAEGPIYPESIYVYNELLKGMKLAYNLAIEHAAEKAQVAVYQRGRDISTWEFKENEQEVMATFDDMGDSELYKVSKESILNLKIKE